MTRYGLVLGVMIDVSGVLWHAASKGMSQRYVSVDGSIMRKGKQKYKYMAVSILFCFEISCTRRTR